VRKRTLPPTRQILYNFGVEYPFPPVGIVGAADGKNRRAFLCLELRTTQGKSSLPGLHFG